MHDAAFLCFQCLLIVREAPYSPSTSFPPSNTHAQCNVLHDTTKPVADILGGYPRGNKELKGLYHKHFTPTTAKEWFTSRGVTLKTEGDGRMFPTTDKSQTIIDTLLVAAEQAGVEIRKKQKVLSITKDQHEGVFVIDTKEKP